MGLVAAGVSFELYLSNQPALTAIKKNIPSGTHQLWLKPGKVAALVGIYCAV